MSATIPAHDRTDSRGKATRPAPDLGTQPSALPRMSGATDSFEALQADPGVDSSSLARAINPSLAVQLLSRLGLSDADIATAVGATDRSVRRWRHASDSTPPTRHRREIDDLRATVLILRESGTLDDEGIIDWLRARNRSLDDARPLEALAQGAFHRVRAAALAFVED